jgi:adenosylcobinamide-GDP ribazoletransferase
LIKNRFLSAFLSAWSVLCRIPLPIKGGFSFNAGVLCFFLPVIGLFPAVLFYAVLRLVFVASASPAVSVIAALTAQYLAFNLFHLDGLMDSADAFLGNAAPEKIRAILKDSRIGVYGFFAGLSCLALKTALLIALFPCMRLMQSAAVILVFPVFGRWSAALIPCVSRPASEQGLGALLQGSRVSSALGGLLLSLVIWAAFCFAASGFGEAIYAFFLLDNGTVLLGGLLLMAATAFFIKTVYRKIGGYTGDALGAAVELGEVLFLGVAAVVLR